jgi:hypothetical protein
MGSAVASQISRAAPETHHPRNPRDLMCPQIPGGTVRRLVRRASRPEVTPFARMAVRSLPGLYDLASFGHRQGKRCELSEAP